MRYLLVLASMILFASSASAQQSRVMGVWLTESGVAQVKLEPCADPKNGPLCGVIVGLINPKGPDGKVVAPEVATDYRNEKAELRSRKVIGMPLIWGFKKTNNPDVFEEGQIYNGEDGKTYSANISLEADGRLKLRGYSGTPLFGKTQYWTRVRQ
ncbi:MAG TPA: DUF2147 domain-containing protein [Reyranella sp.]|nr:DUF2147 domain-containing protein [Reyranella sp.]